MKKEAGSVGRTVTTIITTTFIKYFQLILVE